MKQFDLEELLEWYSIFEMDVIITSRKDRSFVVLITNNNNFDFEKEFDDFAVINPWLFKILKQIIMDAVKHFLERDLPSE